MAYPSIIPPVNTKGIYTLRTPWISDLTHEYTCFAQRRYEDLSADGTDVYTTYYAPKGLTEANYADDLAAGAFLITLASTSTSGATIYVPSTYILSYPDQSSVEYRYVVLGIGLGALYSGIDLAMLEQELSQTCTSIIGVAPTVTVNLSSLSTSVTTQDHKVRLWHCKIS